MPKFLGKPNPRFNATRQTTWDRIHGIQTAFGFSIYLFLVIHSLILFRHCIVDYVSLWLYYNYL